MTIVEVAPASNQFLDWLSAITNLVQALVWPLLIVAGLYWRKELAAILRELPGLLKRLRSGKFGPVEVEFEVLPPEDVGPMPTPPEHRPQLSGEVSERIVERYRVFRK